MGGGDQKSSTTFQLAPEQRDILKLAMPFLQDVKSNPPQPPSGTAIAPFNPIQQTAQAGALGMAPFLGDYAANAWDGNQFLSGGGVLGSTPFNSQFNKVASGQYGASNPAFGTLGRVGGQSMPQGVQSFYRNMQQTGGGRSPGAQAVSGIAQGGARNPVLDMLGMFTSGDLMNVDTNPALRNAIEAATRPIVQNTMQQALPGVRQDFIGAGQYGGTKQGLAEAQTLDAMQRNIGDTSSMMANRAYETGMQGTLQGLGLYGDAWQGGIQQQLQAAGLLDTAFGRQLEARLAGAGALDAGAARDVQNMLTKAGLQDTAFGRQLSSMLEAQGLRSDAYGNELDAMIKGLGLAPQTAGLGMLPWQVMSAVGDTQHGMDMARQQEAYSQQELANMWNLMLGQELAGTVGLIPGGTNISKQPAPQMNPFSMALGGLGLISGLGPLMGLF
jgi:hypothetical protein